MHDDVSRERESAVFKDRLSGDEFEFFYHADGDEFAVVKSLVVGAEHGSLGVFVLLLVIVVVVVLIIAMVVGMVGALLLLMGKTGAGFRGLVLTDTGRTRADGDQAEFLPLNAALEFRATVLEARPRSSINADNVVRAHASPRRQCC